MRRILRQLVIASLAAPALLAQAKDKRGTPPAPVAPLKEATVLPPPAKVSAALTATNRVSLSWSPVPGAESYVVGRATSKGGVRRVPLGDARATSHDDFDIVGGETYTYQVSAVRRGVAGVRGLSEPVAVPLPVEAAKDVTQPLGGGAAGGVAGRRFRISVIGLWATRQTYDNPLQTDGKGDEVYLAAHVAHLDTSRTQVVEHAVLRTPVLGDVNGFKDRIRAGSANGVGESGGLISGDRLPARSVGTPDPKDAGSGFPFVLFEGELVPGQSAVAITPTVWEHDGNPELFARWIVSRQLRMAELVKPEVLALALSSRAYVPMEVASPALAIQTNRFADPRDRPIGMEWGRAADEAAAEVFAAGDTTRAAPLSARGQCRGSGGGFGALLRALACTVRTITGIAGPVLEKIVAQAEWLIGPSVRHGISVGWRLVHERLGGTGSYAVRLEPPDDAFMKAKLDSLRANPGAQRNGINVALPRLLAHARRASGASDAFFFEKMVVLTPTAIDFLHQSSPGSLSRPAGVIDFHYADNETFKGRYTLLLRVEKLR